MRITNGKRLLEARLGRVLRRLARCWSGADPRIGVQDWTATLLRFVHRYVPSEGRGPFPTAILLHGCGGDFDHLASWGRYLASRGILAVTIDSLSPRGLGPLAARCLVCTGLRLRGDERCRDITAILPSVLADPQVDRDRISLVGWSHGAWTLTEWMLDAKAQSVTDAAPIFVDSLVLVYPYCGVLSGIHEKPWTSRSPVLVVTADTDRIVSNDKTRAFAESLSRASVPVTRVALEGVGHAFDVESNGAYDATKAAELREIVVSFLRRREF